MKCALLIYPKPGSHEALGEDEYKEVLGGYFVFDASDLDETLEVAQRIPAVRSAARSRSVRSSRSPWRRRTDRAGLPARVGPCPGS